jgi:hypothetical protein
MKTSSFAKKIQPNKFSSIQRRGFTQTGPIKREFTPPKVRDYSEFDIATKTLNEEYQENISSYYSTSDRCISNNKVYKAKLKGTDKICYIKRFDFLQEREENGMKQPSYDATIFMAYSEASAGTLMRMLLGPQQTPEIELATSTDNDGKPVIWHVSYAINHHGTLNNLKENLGIHKDANEFSIFSIEAKDGKTCISMIDKKGEEHLVRVKNRIALKAALLLVGHKDYDNYSNNVVVKALYDLTEKKSIAMPAMFDFGNAFLSPGFKTAHNCETIEDAAIYLALNPIDDIIKELHLNDKEIAKRWVKKLEALENLLEVSENEAGKVFDWFEGNVPDSQKEIARKIKEAFFETYETVKGAVPIIHKLFDVTKAIMSGDKENGIIPDDDDNLNRMVAYQDRSIEADIGIKKGDIIQGEAGRKYMEILNTKAKNLGIEDRSIKASLEIKKVETGRYMEIINRNQAITRE